MSDSDRKRLPPVNRTTRELYLLSGNQCAFPNCTEPLLKNNNTWNCEVAHIYGVRAASARADHGLTNEQLRAPSNLVLMCPNHHTEIDNKELESTYTVAVVEGYKAEHEAKYRSALGGLEQIVDSTAGVVVKKPKNLCALDGFNDTDDEDINESIRMAAPFIDALAEQPPAMRDLISLILIHGDVQGPWGSVSNVEAAIVKIRAVASSIPFEELQARAGSLVRDGLLVIDESEYGYCYVLIDPTAMDVGWDLFGEIHKFAKKDPEIIRRIINELDFTVLDA